MFAYVYGDCSVRKRAQSSAFNTSDLCADVSFSYFVIAEWCTKINFLAKSSDML